MILYLGVQHQILGAIWETLTRLMAIFQVKKWQNLSIRLIDLLLDLMYIMRAVFKHNKIFHLILLSKCLKVLRECLLELEIKVTERFKIKQQLTIPLKNPQWNAIYLSKLEKVKLLFIIIFYRGFQWMGCCYIKTRWNYIVKVTRRLNKDQNKTIKIQKWTWFPAKLTTIEIKL